MPSKSRNRAPRGGIVASPAAEANPVVAVVEDEPPVDTPEWAELYERAFARYQELRERVDREQEDNHRLWEEFLRAQGEQVPEGERSLVASDEVHERLLQLAATTGH